MRRWPRLTAVCVVAASALLVTASASAQREGTVQPKIVGGSQVSISKYPWQAAVVFTGASSAHARQFCGGSVLTSRIVLTAGHCVFDTDPNCSILGCAIGDPGGDGTAKIDPNDVDVVLGRTTLSDTSQGAEAGVIGTAYQSNFDGNFHGDGVPRFDVGYLVLASPSTQSPIKIADSSAQSLWAPGSPVDISGWGSTSDFGSAQSSTHLTSPVSST